ncbi:hypothetical protein SDC9_176480 [bioreactor metagenome]|uniref:Uncharacterized protein n=1 Tax=bioreactor metagenome TaxID=1076179 RepID=A0A645GSV6_9ZZZZ
MRLNDGDLKPQMPQILRHLKPDEAAADHSGALHAFLDSRLDPVRIADCPQAHDPLGIDPGDRRPQRRGPGGDQQLIVAFPI